MSLSTTGRQRIDAEWVRSGLRIFTETHTQETLDRLLDLPGGRWSPAASSAGRVRKQLTGRETSVWSWFAPTSDQKGPENHLAAILAVLDARRAALNAIARDAEVEITLGYSSPRGQGGLTISHGLLQQLAEYPVGLWLDLYEPNAESGA